MPDKEPQFVVTDRRKFTSDGDLREENRQSAESTSPPVVEKAQPRPEPAQRAQAKPEPVERIADDADLPDDDLMPEPTAAESAQQSKEYQASASRLDEMVRKANPGQPAPQVMNFERLVQSLYMTAAVQMGAGTPPNEQPRIDILGARQSIDMLNVLSEKTEGNLTEAEKRMLQNALFDLRMSFLEITNAIASSAQRPPQPGKLR
jgi:hypothetical protein